jgi:hypothetical protein
MHTFTIQYSHKPAPSRLQLGELLSQKPGFEGKARLNLFAQGKELFRIEFFSRIKSLKKVVSHQFSVKNKFLSLPIRVHPRLSAVKYFSVFI